MEKPFVEMRECRMACGPNPHQQQDERYQMTQQEFFGVPLGLEQRWIVHKITPSKWQCGTG
jgi:hypothetical protein